MPTYDYVCKACAKTWEELQSISEEPVKKCPECGKEEAQRQIGPTSFILMGSGWADTGYAR